MSTMYISYTIVDIPFYCTVMCSGTLTAIRTDRASASLK